MSSKMQEFIEGSPKLTPTKSDEKLLDLKISYPFLDETKDPGVLIREKRVPPYKTLKIPNQDEEDGLYSSSDPLTFDIIKPYKDTSISYQRTEQFKGKLLEIAIRDVKLFPESSSTEIASVQILFKDKIVCKVNPPFNRKLHKLLVHNSDSDHLVIKVFSDRHSSTLPLPLPKRCVANSRLEIDFGIKDTRERVVSGKVICTISVSNRGSDFKSESKTYLYRATDDPNDPFNGLSLLKSRKSQGKKIQHFSIHNPVLSVKEGISDLGSTKKGSRKCETPDFVVLEQPLVSLLHLSFKNWFQPRRPLRPSIVGSQIQKRRTFGLEIVTITILRGVEVPLREESALVQPFIEIQWGDMVRETSMADGPAPVWQQSVEFQAPRRNERESIELRLFDRHPIWGSQWLGEARIPLEVHPNYQEFERWIDLSPSRSPVNLFGYVQASPGRPQTRIYILMKVEHVGSSNALDDSAVDALCKAIQRCVSIPYKIGDVEAAEDCARLAMLLEPLPICYGPLTPRQAVKLCKVDRYGRAAFLASLLQAIGLRAYVALGSSQLRKWAAFVLTTNEANGNVTLWDPEEGEHYDLEDSRCSLIKVSRLINHQNVWENLQKGVATLQCDVKNGKNWRPLYQQTTSTNRTVQNLDPNVPDQNSNGAEEKNEVQEMEQHLKDKLCQWRSSMGLTTVFNRHAISILRKILAKVDKSTTLQFDKKSFRQLHRAYHTHGFILNLRKSNLEELSERLYATKIHCITGPIEFSVVCHIQNYVAKISSLWLAVIILRNRD